MGSFNVNQIKTVAERNQFYQNILDDLDAFQFLLDNGWIEDNENTIGAEQEICIIDRDYQPFCKSLDLLDLIDDDHYTNELALYNLEINLDPEPLTGDCFQKVEKDLQLLYEKGQAAARQRAGHLFLTGILPTLQYRHLQFDHMTPIDRYKLISDTLLKMRGENFEILLQGVDDFNVSLNSVLFEACNTSFQTHLQISPRHFAERFNWSQMIAGPVLAVATNSPMLFGRELWAETRIALFKQSLDTRGKSNPIRKKIPRVYFGDDWVGNSPVELWKKSVMAFPLLLKTKDDSNWKEQVEKGICPKLSSIRLHTGTTYNWNRLCYGVANNSPHIRIECRYLPAGPTIVDEIANFAFWIGLMKGQPEELSTFWQKTDFRIAKDNFIRAARTGINTTFNWLGKPRWAEELLLEELLPLAKKGLEKSGVNSVTTGKYLGIIEQRVLSHQTGAEWQIQNFRSLTHKHNPSVVAKLLTAASLDYQNHNIPVHDWQPIAKAPVYPVGKAETIEHLMNTSVFSIHRKLSVRVAQKVMDWGQFNHLPVEDDQGHLCGILSTNDLKAAAEIHAGLLVEDLMTSELLTAKPTDTLQQATHLMKSNNINCLPVMYNGKLVGIFTNTDLFKLG